MRTAEPHINFPLAAYPDRPYDWSVPYDRALEDSLGPAPSEPDPVTAYPYDWAGPYDWAVEGVFDRPKAGTEPRPSDGSSGSERLATAGAVAGLAALVLNIGVWAYTEIKPEPGPIKADDIPAALPKAVKGQEAGAVKIKYDTTMPIGRTGSGVKIGPDTVLTAGHVVLADNPDRVLDCAGSYVLNRYTGDLGWPDQILNRNAIFNEHNYGQDMGVLRVERTEAFTALPTARIAEKGPDIGDAVFFINYEQSGSNEDYSHYPEGTYGAPDLPEGYDHPAEYAGTVLSKWDSFMAVATGEQGYGPREGRERDTHPGGSGGPVFNEEGELVGLSVAIEPGGNVRAVERYYGVDLPPDPKSRKITIVQIVTPDNVQPFLDRLPETPAC